MLTMSIKPELRQIGIRTVEGPKDPVGNPSMMSKNRQSIRLDSPIKLMASRIVLGAGGRLGI